MAGVGLGSPNYESSPPTVTVTAAPPFPFLCCVRFLTACRASGARRDAATLVARFETGALMRRTEAPPPTHIPHIGAVGEEEGGDRGWAFRALHTLGNHYHKTSHNGVFIYLLPPGFLLSPSHGKKGHPPPPPPPRLPAPRRCHRPPRHL